VDNVGVTGYQVLRNGQPVSRTTATGWADTSPIAGVIYNYTVEAYDAAANLSAMSNSVTASVGGGGKKR